MTKDISQVEVVNFATSQLDNFASKLNIAPAKEDVFVNKMANGSKYLPISYIQMKLDEVFLGLWSTENFTSQVIANEIVGQIELKVFHPVSRTWITRIGAASVMIQQKKGAEITDINAKHKNTLVKDYPHLLSECVKSAAKSLGKFFGRDLNRMLNDDYDSFIEKAKTVALDETIEAQIAECNNKSELVKLATDNEWFNNEIIIDLMNKQFKVLAKRKHDLLNAAAKKSKK